MRTNGEQTTAGGGVVVPFGCSLKRCAAVVPGLRPVRQRAAVVPGEVRLVLSGSAVPGRYFLSGLHRSRRSAVAKRSAAQ
ncbi:hypothetical protein SAMN04487917_105411 [Arthrobacter sp. yr096]|nr:hypothetical protein SAMN04487917_105411 [Arthrobacter sp. yr096]